MPASAHNVESVIFFIFMKINAWLIVLMDMLKIQHKTNAKNVSIIVRPASSQTPHAPLATLTMNLSISINRIASILAPSMWVSRCQIFNVEIVTLAARLAKISRTSVLLVSLIWDSILLSTLVPQFVKKACKFTTSKRVYVSTVTPHALLVLVILQLAPLVDLDLCWIQITLANLVAWMTIKSHYKECVRLANFHAHNARVILKDASNAKENTCFIMPLVFSTVHLSLRLTMWQGNVFMRDLSAQKGFMWMKLEMDAYPMNLNALQVIWLINKRQLVCQLQVL